MITGKFKRLMRRERQGFNKKGIIKGDTSKDKDKKQPMVCYGCKKPGHFKTDYPLLKKASKKFKKKIMINTWSKLCAL